MSYDYDKEKERIKLNSKALFILKNRHLEEYNEIREKLKTKQSD